MDKRKLGITLTIIGSIFWGFSGTAGSYLFTYKDATSDWLVPIRLFIAGFVLICVIAVRKGVKAAFGPWSNGKDALAQVLFSLLGMSLCQYAYFTCIQYSNAGVATTIEYIAPAIILLYVCLRDRKLPSVTKVVALVFVFAGTVILATHGDLSTLSLSPLALIWGLIAALAMCFYTLQPVDIIARYGTLTILGWGMFIGGIVLGLIFRPFSIPVIFDIETVEMLVIVIFFGTILAFSMFLEGVQNVGPVDASLISCVEPVAAVIISAVWLKTPFAIMDIVGMAVIILAITALSLIKE